MHFEPYCRSSHFSVCRTEVFFNVDNIQCFEIYRTTNCIQISMSDRNPDNLISIEEKIDHNFTIVVLGELTTGKTSIIQRFVSPNHFTEPRPTLHIDFKEKNILVDDKRVKLHIWDTAGQERHRALTRSYYRGADAVILVYDITKRSTFVRLQRWLKDIRDYASSKTIVILVGNKYDLQDSREVQESAAENFSKDFPEIFQTIEVSAKENINIESLFYRLASELKKRSDNNLKIVPADGNIIRINARINAENQNSSYFSSCWGCWPF